MVGYDKGPIPACEMKIDKHLVTKCYSRDYQGYSKENDFEGLFSEIAINEYDIMDENNKFTEPRPNEYTVKIIEENHNNKWFMGEDEI